MATVRALVFSKLDNRKLLFEMAFRSGGAQTRWPRWWR